MLILRCGVGFGGRRPAAGGWRRRGCNLLPLCRRHHRLKTHTTWRLTLHPDRRAEWTSPTGRRYTVHPDHDDDPDHTAA